MSRTSSLFAILVIVPLSLAAPAAGADDLCNPVAEQVPAVPTPLGEAYLREQGGARQVWRETNGVPGLQTWDDATCGRGTGKADFLWVNGDARL